MLGSHHSEEGVKLLARQGANFLGLSLSDLWATWQGRAVHGVRADQSLALCRGEAGPDRSKDATDTCIGKRSALRVLLGPPDLLPTEPPDPVGNVARRDSRHGFAA